VIPPFAFQALEHDDVVSEERGKAAVKDLDYVRLGDAARELVNERGRA